MISACLKKDECYRLDALFYVWGGLVDGFSGLNNVWWQLIGGDWLGSLGLIRLG